jgi:uncharacterized protein with GYD domain
MSKYLFQGSYTDNGLKGLMKDGGSKRVEVTRKAIESLGGKMETYYFALGEKDFFIIFEAPDNIKAIAGSLIANASGTVKGNITVLLSPEEVDLAVKQSMDWKAPGK